CSCTSRRASIDEDVIEEIRRSSVEDDHSQSVSDSAVMEGETLDTVLLREVDDNIAPIRWQPFGINSSLARGYHTHTRGETEFRSSNNLSQDLSVTSEVYNFMNQTFELIERLINIID